MKYARIAGTGSYLPPRVVTNRRARARRRRHHRRVDRRAHRHPAAPHRRRAADVERPRARGGARGARGRRHERRRSRPDHRRHLDARLRLSRAPRACCRRSSACTGCAAFDVQAVCSGFVYALADGRQLRSRTGQSPARRWWSAPRCSRASSTGTTAPPACCSATAPARWCSSADERPGIHASELHADGSHAGILAVPGQRLRRQDRRPPVPADGRARRCSSSR